MVPIGAIEEDESNFALQYRKGVGLTTIAILQGSVYTTPKLLSTTSVGFNSPFHAQTSTYYYLLKMYFIATSNCLVPFALAPCSLDDRLKSQKHLWMCATGFGGHIVQTSLQDFRLQKQSFLLERGTACQLTALVLFPCREELVCMQFRSHL